MRRHWIVTVAVLFAMVLATGWALAQQGDPPERREGRDRVRRGRQPRDRMRRTGRTDPLLRGIVLDEGQKTKVAALREDATKEIKAINDQLQKDIKAQLNAKQLEVYAANLNRQVQSAEIRKVAMAKMEKAETREARRAIMEKMRKDLDELGGPADRPRGRRRPPRGEDE